MNPLVPFADQQFLNLETFRKNGEGTKPPVWFVQDGDILDEAIDRQINRLLEKKYGLVKKTLGLVSTLQGRKGTILEIKPGELAVAIPTWVTFWLVALTLIAAFLLRLTRKTVLQSS